MYEYGQLPKHVFFDIIDTRISPILLYGCEIWGASEQKSTELIQNMRVKDICASVKKNNNNN